MNLAPVTDVYTIPADQSYKRIPSMPAETRKGGLAYGAEPLGMDYVTPILDKLLIDKDLLADDDEKQVLVNIPRYNGAKNTRVDFFEYEQNTFHVTGIANHPQPSCVYLRNEDTIQFTADSIGNGIYPVRPNLFAVQRRFKKMFWEAQNVRGIIEVPTHEFIKLAPYICDKDKLHRLCMPKWSYQKTGALYLLHFTSFEPVLSFQSGWALLDAKRPFNQQNMMYPLAIQDYSMRFEEYSSDVRIQRSYNLEVNSLFGDDIFVPSNSYSTYDHFLDDEEKANTDETSNLVFTGFEDLLKDPTLVTFSQNTAIQANKDVSMVKMHAPEFDNYSISKSFSVLAERITNPDPVYASLDQTIVPEDKVLQLEIDTPKGYPSFLMLYTEFYNMTTRAGRPLSLSVQPRIKTLKISFYGQKNPLIANLTQSELEYITKKNCHKNSDFSYAYRVDPICLLDLESLGLGREDVGYPIRKRLRCTVECTELQLPARFARNYADSVERQGAAGVQVPFDVGIQFKCVFIYENRVIEGSVNQLKIIRKY